MRFKHQKLKNNDLSIKWCELTIKHEELSPWKKMQSWVTFNPFKNKGEIKGFCTAITGVHSSNPQRCVQTSRLCGYNPSSLVETQKRSKTDSPLMKNIAMAAMGNGPWLKINMMQYIPLFNMMKKSTSPAQNHRTITLGQGRVSPSPASGPAWMRSAVKSGSPLLA